MLLGCIAYGSSTSLFLQPASIVAGGVSGFAVMLNLLFDKLPVGMMIIALNIPILLAGLRMQGIKFIFRALVTILTLGVITDLLAYIPFTPKDGVLASLYGGICQGIGIGLFLRYEFSSGGTELLGRIISNLVKVVRIPVCVGVLDGIVVVLGAIVTKDPNNMLYALIVIFVSTKLSEWILVGGEKSKLCIIITDKGVDISNSLLQNSPRGVTMLEGEGMYTHKDRNDNAKLGFFTADEYPLRNLRTEENNDKGVQHIVDVANVNGTQNNDDCVQNPYAKRNFYHLN